ncbi:MAG: hypothetical protein M3Q08_10695 [Pseudomonadota bacterium]|nr:hypothetical protein [Pseudomonadota bacterium]
MATTTEAENGTQTGTANGADAATTGRVRQALDGARTRASVAYGAARERTNAVYGSARERASGATRQTAQRVETNPLVAVAGGLAVGAILGAILPRTEREMQALGSVGHIVTDAAREAANTAVETGRQQVNELTSNAMAKVGGAVVQAVVSGDGAQNQ